MGTTLLESFFMPLRAKKRHRITSETTFLCLQAQTGLLEPSKHFLDVKMLFPCFQRNQNAVDIDIHVIVQQVLK
ncbi:hypothetical protein L596_028582 [Steinernema carpocapsae]|uniref:Uncharacterized protein n=1 Tax=Steinernema carpocapsae TaxID=34508 RepID=A0A4U5LYU1_STECR|nr:hypothetical protein L596_028582 [Steinernema carpocapsae]